MTKYMHDLRGKLIAKLEKNIHPKKPLYKGYMNCKYGMYGFCDGYRAYITNEDYGYPEAQEQMHLDNLIPRGQTYRMNVDIEELKSYIKEQKTLIREYKKEHPRGRDKVDITPIVYHPENQFAIGFNPEYLLDFCRFFNTDVVYCTGPLSPCQYLDMDTQEWGILLPCRIKTNVPEFGEA